MFMVFHNEQYGSDGLCWHYSGRKRSTLRLEGMGGVRSRKRRDAEATCLTAGGIVGAAERAIASRDQCDEGV